MLLRTRERRKVRSPLAGAMPPVTRSVVRQSDRNFIQHLAPVLSVSMPLASPSPVIFTPLTGMRLTGAPVYEPGATERVLLRECVNLHR